MKRYLGLRVYVALVCCGLPSIYRFGSSGSKAIVFAHVNVVPMDDYRDVQVGEDAVSGDRVASV